MIRPLVARGDLFGGSATEPMTFFPTTAPNFESVSCASSWPSSTTGASSAIVISEACRP